MSYTPSFSPVMSADEFVEARAGFDLSQVDFARMINRSPSAVSRYERGLDVVPYEIALLIRLLEHVGPSCIEGFGR